MICMLSTFAFEFNLRRYRWVELAELNQYVRDGKAVPEDETPGKSKNGWQPSSRTVLVTQMTLMTLVAACNVDEFAGTTMLRVLMCMWMLGLPQRR
jgi:hypothetical protein